LPGGRAGNPESPTRDGALPKCFIAIALHRINASPALPHCERIQSRVGHLKPLPCKRRACDRFPFGLRTFAPISKLQTFISKSRWSSHATSMPRRKRSTPQRRQRGQNTVPTIPDEPDDLWHDINGILAERRRRGRTEYLVDWEPNAVTGQTYDPSWV
jgi:hypothetical protein